MGHITGDVPINLADMFLGYYPRISGTSKRWQGSTPASSRLLVFGSLVILEAHTLVPVYVMDLSWLRNVMKKMCVWGMCCGGK